MDIESSAFTLPLLCTAFRHLSTVPLLLLLHPRSGQRLSSSQNVSRPLWSEHVCFPSTQRCPLFNCSSNSTLPRLRRKNIWNCDVSCIGDSISGAGWDANGKKIVPKKMSCRVPSLHDTSAKDSLVGLDLYFVPGRVFPISTPLPSISSPLFPLRPYQAFAVLSRAIGDCTTRLLLQRSSSMQQAQGSSCPTRQNKRALIAHR